MDVVVAPDGFGGTLTPSGAAAAIAEGWASVRPQDRVVAVPMSDGGEGLLDALRAADPTAVTTGLEVAGADARPRRAELLRCTDGTVVVESAEICGLRQVPPGLRRPLEATTYGVGQALAAAVADGARTLVVGLGGTATVDGGSGALNGLGLRLRTADGGLRVGAGDLGSCTVVEPGWLRWPEGIELTLLHDVDLPLAAAAPRFGPQKGLDADAVTRAGAALERWADVLETTFPDGPGRDAPGAGAAGGLGWALATALGGRLAAGAPWVDGRVGLDRAVAAADLVVTGEGRLDATSGDGKVVGHVVTTARRHGRAVAAVVGALGPGADAVLDPARRRVAPVDPDGDAAGPVRSAAAALARDLTRVH